MNDFITIKLIKNTFINIYIFILILNSYFSFPPPPTLKHKQTNTNTIHKQQKGPLHARHEVQGFACVRKTTGRETWGHRRLVAIVFPTRGDASP